MKEPAKIHNAKRPTHTNIEPIQRQQPTHTHQAERQRRAPYQHGAKPHGTEVQKHKG
jgi:hypothetical protein